MCVPEGIGKRLLSMFWGVPGIILATPTLVALKVVAENKKTGTKSPVTRKRIGGRVLQALVHTAYRLREYCCQYLASAAGVQSHYEQ